MPKAFDLGNPRIMTSTEALEIEEIPKDLFGRGRRLYRDGAGGRSIAALGSKVTVVEALGSILAPGRIDLLRPVVRYAEKNFRPDPREYQKSPKMSTAGKTDQGAIWKPKAKKLEELYDRVLVSVGRVPNCNDLGLENTKIREGRQGVHQGQLPAGNFRPHIFRGRRCGRAELLLAHKAAGEARVGRGGHSRRRPGRF